MARIRLDVDASNRVDIPSIDAAWKQVAARSRIDQHVLLDLSHARYIDHECLPYLLSLLASRSKARMGSSLALPTSERVLDFLRAWEFPTAVERVTGQPFKSMLDKRSRDQFTSIMHQPSRYTTVVTTPNGGRETLLPVSFFALTPVALTAPAQAATMISSKWLDAHVLSVLDNYLSNDGDRVASHILYEAVLNAATHPNATTAYTSAQLVVPPPSRSTTPAELIISVWDDGASIERTLSEGMRHNGTITSPLFGLVKETFEVAFMDYENDANERFMLVSNQQIDDTSKSRLTVAAFFLGVTSNQHSRTPRAGSVPLSEYGVPQSAGEYGGLGLHLIRRTVIDRFGGRLFYATGRDRVLLKQGRARSEYSAMVFRHREDEPTVEGNLLLARMPLVQQ